MFFLHLSTLLLNAISIFAQFQCNANLSPPLPNNDDSVTLIYGDICPIPATRLSYKINPQKGEDVNALSFFAAICNLMIEIDKQPAMNYLDRPYMASNSGVQVGIGPSPGSLRDMQFQEATAFLAYLVAGLSHEAAPLPQMSIELSEVSKPRSGGQLPSIGLTVIKNIHEREKTDLTIRGANTLTALVDRPIFILIPGTNLYIYITVLQPPVSLDPIKVHAAIDDLIAKLNTHPGTEEFHGMERAQAGNVLAFFLASSYMGHTPLYADVSAAWNLLSTFLRSNAAATHYFDLSFSLIRHSGQKTDLGYGHIHLIPGCRRLARF